VTFLSRCQNRSESNDQPWVTDDPKNKGGFIYSPTSAKSEETLPDGRKALRSCGSMSYAGLLSLVYAKLSPEDPRVVAVKDWLGKNYTVSENPGLGDQGLYYYYHAMPKALAAANLSTLKLADGTEADWRKDLGEKLLSLQQPDGSWEMASRPGGPGGKSAKNLQPITHVGSAWAVLGLMHTSPAIAKRAGASSRSAK